MGVAVPIIAITHTLLVPSARYFNYIIEKYFGWYFK